MENKEGEKIRILLRHWIEHNKEHSQEFREWAGKAQVAGETMSSENMILAAQEMDQASVFLSRALSQLAGKEQ